MHLKSFGLLSKLRRIRLLSATAAAIAVIAIAGALPAAAAPNTANTPGGSAATARFQEYGDHIYLCDHAEDGHSVAVDLDYTDGDGDHREYWRWNWWGPYKYNGCKDINLEAKEGSWFGFRVCLGNHGRPGPPEADVLESTCGDWVWVWNDE